MNLATDGQAATVELETGKGEHLEMTSTLQSVVEALNQFDTAITPVIPDWKPTAEPEDKPASRADLRIVKPKKA